MWFSSNFQQLHDGFDRQGRPFRQCDFVIDLISGDLQGFVDWYINEITDNVKANEGV
jgi:hypothetical protein